MLSLTFLLAAYTVRVAGHSMDLIAVEGHDVRRRAVGAITMYIGSRYDVILCFDQVSC